MSYCPTCGCVSIQWAGCTDDYHYSPAVVDAEIEHVYGGSTTKSGSAGVTSTPDPWPEPQGGPRMKDVSTQVNPCPALDGA